MRLRCLWASSYILLCASLASGAPAVSVKPAWISDFLKTRLELSDSELSRVARGETVARMIGDRGDREIAVLGVIALPQAPDGWSADFDLVERVRRGNPDLVGIGTVGRPPSAEDLSAVEIEAKTLPQLRKCRPSQCGMNLPEAAIDAIKGEAERNAADFETKVNEVFRAMLRDVASRYQEAGDSSLPVFTNRTRLVPTSDAAGLLLTHRPGLAQLSPLLDQHFRSCPQPKESSCASDLYYWYREKSWKHEVVGLVQAAFDEETIGTGHYRLLAEKTFFANHYFRSALSLTGVLEDPSGSYLFYLNRSETDNGGPFNFIEKALAGYLVPRHLAHTIVAFRDGLLAHRPRAAGVEP